MTIKLLTEHNLEFLSLRGDCTVSYESTLVKMPHCWKSHVTDHMYIMSMHDSSKLSRFCLVVEAEQASDFISRHDSYDIQVRMNNV